MKKRILSLALALTMLASLCAFAPVSVSAEISKEILIYNEADLKQISSGNDYKLMADIEISEPWTPLAKYSGTFDGNGHTIANLSFYIAENVNFYGLFSEIVNATVSNLTITVDTDIPNFSCDMYSYGTVCGYSNNSTIKNCIINGKIDIANSHGYTSNTEIAVKDYDSIGGICGIISNGSRISNCISNCNIISSSKRTIPVGGIAGVEIGDNDSIIEICTNNGNICAFGKNGGIVGETTGNSHIYQCKNNGSILGNFCNGGVVGDSCGNIKIEQSFNCGAISSDKNGLYYGDNVVSGGIIGRCGSSTIENCYNFGSVSSGISGGIIGDGCDQINDVYNWGTITSQNNQCGGIIGYGFITISDLSSAYFSKDKTILGVGRLDIGSDTTIGLSDVQMKQKESFSGFDFDTIWDINPEINDGYPYLRCFYEETAGTEFGISSIDSGVAGSWFSFDVEFSSLPTSAYLQFDAPDDDWNWLSEKYCMNHETFKIPVADLTEANGKYIGTVTLIIYSTGNPDDSYNRAVRINADFAGEKKQSEIVRFKVEPIPEKPNRSFGNLYEQTSEPQEIDTYPQILSVLVQKLNGQYLLEVSSYIAEDKENVFFYWETDNGEFTGTSNKYDVAKLNAPEGATVTVTIGDGYGYISTKTIELPAID